LVFMKMEKTISRQPRKLRKAMYRSKIHELKRNISIHLSKELRKTMKKRSALAKKGDKVRVLTGEFRKREGKIIDVNVKTGKIYIEQLIIKKQGGKEKPVAIEPSNCILLEWAEPRKKERRAKAKKTVASAAPGTPKITQAAPKNSPVAPKPTQAGSAPVAKQPQMAQSKV
jgi:large subunit ribosomal protein L24